MNTIISPLKKFFGTISLCILLISPLAVAHAAGTASIASVSPSTTVVFGNSINIVVAESGFTNPTFQVTDSFPDTSVGNSNINMYSGYFAWLPQTSDIGTHTLTFTIRDSSGNIASVEQTIVIAASTAAADADTATTTSTPVQTSVATSVPTSVPTSTSGMTIGTSVIVGSPVTFTVSSPSLVGPTYTLSDSFSGSTVSNADIQSSGQFTWTPAPSDVGTHVITINGADSQGHTASTNMQVDVIASATGATPSAISTTSDAPVATSTPSFNFTTAMALGDKGTDVTDLQTYLTQQGLYSGPITGYYGSLTQTAVESFQTAHGISPLGNVGPLTLAALNQNASSAVASTTPSTTTDTTAATTTAGASSYTFTTQMALDDSGDEVTALQNKLTALGDYSGPVTGYYGSLTQAAVEKFQMSQGLSPVGYVGPATMAALNK